MTSRPAEPSRKDAPLAATALSNDVVPLPQRRFHRALHSVRAAPSCAACGVLPFCLSSGGDHDAAVFLDDLVVQRMQLKKGDVLAHRGDPLTALYAIHSGSCKSVLTTTSGGEQIVRYRITGEVVGAAAISAGVHDATVTALEDSEFCVIQFDRVQSLARQNGEFQRRFNAFLSHEIALERKLMLVLGTMRAEQRLASFLLDLGDRYKARGYSSCEFVLRMTREEIGSHLGLKLETVSRLFSRFHQEGLIGVQGREVKLLDRAGLQRIIDSAEP
jgi:CRP/FNR family transcriptional regulator, anaerobic regulatory protein